MTMEVFYMRYFVDKPYPSVDGLDVNVTYGQIILSNIGSVVSEMSAVSLYFYDHVILEEVWPELSKAMHDISIVEMHHLEIFADMCYRLGVDPRLWSCQNDFLEYWSPGYNVYPRQIPSLLENAIIQEEKAIETYQQQAQCIPEPIIQAALNRIILDEKLHVEIFQYFLQQYHSQSHFYERTVE